MEHSKLPWKAEQDKPNSGVSIFSAGEPGSREWVCATSGRAIANADFIVKACNEHDELVEELNLHKAALTKFEHLTGEELVAYKAKADMFDKMVDVLELFTEADGCNTHVLPRTKKDANALLAKAKAVSSG